MTAESAHDSSAGKPMATNAEILLQATGLSKRFCRDYRRSLLYGAQDIAGMLLHRPFPKDQLRAKEFWALRDVSFTLRRGEAIGIVGKNGSGKTTLLRILAGLINPTLGQVIRRGRLAPMLALGAGFNPVLTGRENIYVNMSILGVSKAEIDERFDSVVSFAEIEESLDAAVQNYSSGMAARLGFACAVHTAPDILLIDEVMAVGDIAFQKKCQKRLLEMREAGTAFIIVNHAPQLIVDTCQEALYLKDSRCQMSGEAMQVIRTYEEDLRLNSVARPEIHSPGEAELSPTSSEASHAVRILSCAWRANDAEFIASGGSATFTIEMEVRQPQQNVAFMLRIEPAVGLQQLHWKEVRQGVAQAASILVASSSQDGFVFPQLAIGKSSFSLVLFPVGLTSGHYRYLLWLFASPDAETPVLLDLNTGYFDVACTEEMQGSNYFQPRVWKMNNIENNDRYCESTPIQ